MLIFIGGPELVLILFVIVIFFGSKRLPEFVKSFAKAMNEIRSASSEISNEIKKSTDDVNDTISK